MGVPNMEEHISFNEGAVISPGASASPRDKHCAELMQFNLKRLSDPVNRNRWGRSTMKALCLHAVKWHLSYVTFKP